MFLLVVPANLLAAIVWPPWIVPTLLAIAPNAFFFWLGRRYYSKSRMAYQFHDYVVIGQPNVASLGDIKILFNNVPVPRVVVTQLAVWNTGNTVVKGAEIVESSPLTVCFGEGAVILDAQRVNVTNEASEFRIRVSEQDPSRALLEFDYLNSRDGAKFQIIHTGVKDGLKVTGSIRGIPKGVQNWGNLQEWREQKSKLSGMVYPLMYAVLIGVLVWIKNLIAAHHPTISRYTDWVTGAVAGLVGLLFLFAISFSIFTISEFGHALRQSLYLAKVSSLTTP